MKISRTDLDGVLVLEPAVYRDDRGFFTELYHEPRYREAGLPPFVQDNLAGSGRKVLRGLHYQWPRPQGKLIHAAAGAVLDVAVDIRVGSPSFGRWVGVELSEENRRQLYIPPGFAHGYVVLGASALVAYKCTDVHVPENDRVIRWDDPTIGVDWPLADPVISDKDRNAPLLADIRPEELPGSGDLIV